MYSLKTGQSFGITSSKFVIKAIITFTNLSVVLIQNFINLNFINTEESTYPRKHRINPLATDDHLN